MTRDECLGKGKAKSRGGMDGDGGEAKRGGEGSPRLRQMRTNSAGGQGGLECFKGEEERREDNQDSTEKERGLWREKPEPPGRGELALTGERHSRAGMRYALLLL